MADGRIVLLTERPAAKYRWKLKQGHNEIKLSTQQMFALTSEFMAMAMPSPHDHATS
jgi:hypothetical protein